MLNQLSPFRPVESGAKGLGLVLSVVLHGLVFAILWVSAKNWVDAGPIAARPLEVFLTNSDFLELTAPPPSPPKVIQAPKTQPKQVRKSPLRNPEIKLTEKESPKNQVSELPRKPTSAQKPRIAESLNKPLQAIQQNNTPAPASPPESDLAQRPVKRQIVETAPKVNAQYAASNPKPVYPPMARRLGQQGTVTLNVLVNAQGKAEKVKVSQSSGFDSLDQAAVKAILQWRFEPATQDGKPVRQWLSTRWSYHLEN